MLLYAHYLSAKGRVSTNTHQPQPGTLFFTLNGPRFRSANFAPLAVAQGAAHAVVNDTALAAAAAWFRQYPLLN